jgi:hypothetical protein
MEDSPTAAFADLDMAADEHQVMVVVRCRVRRECFHPGPLLNDTRATLIKYILLSCGPQGGGPPQAFPPLSSGKSFGRRTSTGGGGGGSSMMGVASEAIKIRNREAQRKHREKQKVGHEGMEEALPSFALQWPNLAIILRSHSCTRS